MADYVLTANVFKVRDEKTGVPRRYKRGDTVPLTAEQAERLLKVGAVVKAGSGEAEAAEEHPGDEATTAPAAPEADANNVSTFAAAAANSGLGPEDAYEGGVLSDQQWDEIEGVSSGERPPKSATVDVWRKYAVDSGKVSADDAAEMTKAELQDATE